MNNGSDESEEDGGLPADFELADAKRRADQMSINFHFLLERIESMHAMVCPGQIGTSWQNRADQVLAAVKALKGKE